MSMDYFIKADIDTDCDDDFPESLSNFLEQYPVSDFQGEARQISKILNINLDPFFVYGTGYEGPEEEQKFWQDLAAFEALVDSFLSKIAENKEYYKQVLAEYPENGLAKAGLNMLNSIGQTTEPENKINNSFT